MPLPEKPKKTYKRQASPPGHPGLKPLAKGEQLATGSRAVYFRGIRKMNRETLAEIGHVLLKGTYKDLEEYAQDKNLPALAFLVARIVQRASTASDHKAFATLMNQIMGHPKTPVDLQMSGHAALMHLVNQAENPAAPEDTDDDDFPDFD